MSTSDKPEFPNEATADKPCVGYKINKEAAIALHDAGYTVQVIAEKVGCTDNNIYKLIARVKANKEPIKKYRESQADLVDQLSMDLLAKLQADDLKDISVNNPNEIKSLVTALAISIDKSQLLKGKTTSNVSVRSYEHSVKELHVMDSNIKELEEELASCGDESID